MSATLSSKALFPDFFWCSIIITNVTNILHYKTIQIHSVILTLYSPPRARVFITLFVQYYIVIFRPSHHSVGRPGAEIRTREGNTKVLFIPIDLQVWHTITSESAAESRSLDLTKTEGFIKTCSLTNGRFVGDIFRTSIDYLK